jgi:hypothetical protein
MKNNSLELGEVEKLEKEIFMVEALIEDMDLNPRASLNEIKKMQNKLSLLRKELKETRGKYENTFNV